MKKLKNKKKMKNLKYNLLILFLLVTFLSFSQIRRDTVVLLKMDVNLGGLVDKINTGTSVLETEAWSSFYGIGIISWKTNKIFNWQKEYKFERIIDCSLKNTKNIVTYKELEMPFQFVSDTIVRIPGYKSFILQVFGTKKNCIKYYIDNKHNNIKKSCKYRIINYNGIDLYKNTIMIKNLTPDTEYKILIEGTVEENKGFNILEFKIKTLK